MFPIFFSRAFRATSPRKALGAPSTSTSPPDLPPPLVGNAALPLPPPPIDIAPPLSPTKKRGKRKLKTAKSTDSRDYDVKAPGQLDLLPPPPLSSSGPELPPPPVGLMGFTKLVPIPQPIPSSSTSSASTSSNIDGNSLIQQKHLLRASLEQRLSTRPSPEEIAKSGADSSSPNFFESLKSSLFGKKQKRKEMEISGPVSFSHNVHVSFDVKTSTGFHVSILQSDS